MELLLFSYAEVGSCLGSAFTQTVRKLAHVELSSCDKPQELRLESLPFIFYGTSYVLHIFLEHALNLTAVTTYLIIIIVV
jgi:hypothetical protein